MKRHNVVSSDVESIAFRRSPLSQRGTLEVQFCKGAVYKYYRIPTEVYNAVQSSDSIGSALHLLIKRAGYKYARVL